MRCRWISMVLGLLIVAAATSHVPGRATAADPMPLSGGSQLAIVTANLYEMWNNADLGEIRDLQHFAYRIRSVLTAEAAPAPDVVVLQEVNAESAVRIAQLLTNHTGHTYAVGVSPASGPGAIVGSSTARPLVRFETAIVHNTATTTVAFPASSLISYPESQNATANWLSLRQATALVTKKASGQRFAVYSAHFPVWKLVTDYDEYGRIWANFLKHRMANIPDYAGATPVIAGDFNRSACINETDPELAPSYMTHCEGAPGERVAGVWEAMTTSTADGPGTYRASHGPGEGGVDNIFTTGSIVRARWDIDYKVYREGEPSRFPTWSAYRQCLYLYEGGTLDGKVYPGGQGGSDEADGIAGCAERYYSDHPYLWAVIAP